MLIRLVSANMDMRNEYVNTSLYKKLGYGIADRGNKIRVVNTIKLESYVGYNFVLIYVN